MLNPARPDSQRADFDSITTPGVHASTEAQRTAAWIAHEDVADAAELVGNAVVGATVAALNYNLALAEFAGANASAMLTFAHEIGRASGPADALMLSNAHAIDRRRALHRQAGELAGLAQAMLNDFSRPYRTRAILGYSVVR